MGYDEKIFKAKANIKARRLWLVFAILLTANYGTDTANGAYSVSSYIIFVILCWLPFVCGDILLKRKGKDNDHLQAYICHRIWYFLRISFVYDNLTDCIHLHSSDNQPYCNI